ncbi:MAG: DEAD/DEAH box helicase, partial [bacterium]|nr:DEAD/DEAH box helicase [bacterium]
EKVSLILGILKKDLPRNALIFTNMKHTAARVARQLEYNGYKCQYISGDLPQNKRLNTINSFKEGKLPFLVATDVAARGLHVDDLELIINYDIPGDCENYVHRIGRTARAGKSGKAISLACENFIYNLDAIESFIGTKIPVLYPEEDLFLEDRGAGINFDRLERGAGKSRASRLREKSSHRKPATRTGKYAMKKRRKDNKEMGERKEPGDG